MVAILFLDHWKTKLKNIQYSNVQYSSPSLVLIFILFTYTLCGGKQTCSTTLDSVSNRYCYAKGHKSLKSNKKHIYNLLCYMEQIEFIANQKWIPGFGHGLSAGYLPVRLHVCFWGSLNLTKMKKLPGQFCR